MNRHLFVVACVIAAPVWSQGKSEAVRDLNNRTLQLHALMKQAASDRATVRGRAAEVLSERASALAALIRENPRAALGLAFASELLADLAEEFPDSKGSLEEQGSWSGTSEHVILDDPERSARAAEVRIQTPKGFLNIYSAVGEPHCISGNILTVEGVRIGNVAAAGNLKVESAGVAAAGACPTLGVQNSAVLLVQFPSVPLPTAASPTAVWDIFFNNSGRSVTGY